VVQHKSFALDADDAKNLLGMIRAELLERSEYTSNSLLLLNAVLSTHVIIVEVYDIIPVVTELMMHRATQRLIRIRCVSVLARFLTEYKMTHDKLRSHIDLYLQNLEFPTPDGCIALLDLLDVLIHRLPVVILEEEASVMLVPLANVLSKSPWAEAKQRAATVIAHLFRFAGVNALRGVLSAWMGSTDTGVRTTAAQVWAIAIPALAPCSDSAHDPATSWSYPFVSSAIFFDQLLPSLRRRLERLRPSATPSVARLPKKLRVKSEMKDWQLIFFGLRCLESLCERCGFGILERLPHTEMAIVERVVSSLCGHAHPWVRGASVRWLMRYLQEHVEAATAITGSTDIPAKLRSTKHANDDLPESWGFSRLCIYDSVGDEAAGVDVRTALSAYFAAISFVKQLLTCVEEQDIAREQLESNRAIADPTRLHTVRVILFLWKMSAQLFTAILMMGAAHRAALMKSQTDLWITLSRLCDPVVKRNFTLDGYLVRVASTVQIVAGVVSTSPTPRDPSEGVSEEGLSRRVLQYNEAVCDLLHCIPHEKFSVTFVPLMSAAAKRSDALAEVGLKAIAVIEKELPNREPWMKKTIPRNLCDVDADQTTDLLPSKRRRLSGGRSTTVTVGGDASIVAAAERVVSDLRQKRAQRKLERSARKTLRAAHRAN
jgi:U3 small nucleolar RNA-associated protein 20